MPHLDVIVEDEQLSLAIGKRGQNVRLASELIGSQHRHQERERRQGRGGRRPRPHAADRDGADAGAGRRGRRSWTSTPPRARRRGGRAAPGGRLRRHRRARRRRRRRRCSAWGSRTSTRSAPRPLIAWAKEQREQRVADLDIGPFRAPGGGPRGRLDGRRGLHGGPQPRLRRERAAARERGPRSRAVKGKRPRRPRSVPRRTSSNQALGEDEAGPGTVGIRGVTKNIWERFESRTSRR